MIFCWSDIVNEIFKRIEDLVILCPSCSSDDFCVTDLSRSPPVDIKILNECCSCMLENVLDPMQYVDRIYYSNEFGESIAIYKLGDVIIEISTATATVVPLAKLINYVEILEESSYLDLDVIKRWLKELRDFTSNCVEKH